MIPTLNFASTTFLGILQVGYDCGECYLVQTAEQLPVIQRHLIGHLPGAEQVQGSAGPRRRTLLLWQRSLKSAELKQSTFEARSRLSVYTSLS